MSKGKEDMFRVMAEGKQKGYKHISFSEFSLFRECGHKHLIEKHLGLDQQPPSIHLYFGNAIHESIERTFENEYSTDKRVEHFKLTFRKDMIENMKDTPEFADLDAFTDQGENMLRTIDVEAFMRDYEIVSVEEPLYEHIYGIFYFKGFIDFVVKNRKTGRIVIIDWKTSSEPWNMYWKNKNKTFLMQMKLYKYFWARKNNVDLTQIDTKYVVLNRLKNKKKPDMGFGEIVDVPMTSSLGEIRQAIEAMSESLNKIHIKQDFQKAKFVLDFAGNPTVDLGGNYLRDDKNSCRFCSYKGGKHPLCSGFPDQDKTLLKEHGKLK